MFPCWHRLPAWEPVLLERNFRGPYILVGCQEPGSAHHDQITMTTPPTLPEAVRQGHKGSLAPTGRTGQPQQRCQSAQLPSITLATPITAPPGFHQPRKCIFEATTVGLRSLRLLTLGLSRGECEEQGIIRGGGPAAVSISLSRPA